MIRQPVIGELTLIPNLSFSAPVLRSTATWPMSLATAGLSHTKGNVLDWKSFCNFASDVLQNKYLIIYIIYKSKIGIINACK